jgi:hypothetical protein
MLNLFDRVRTTESGTKLRASGKAMTGRIEGEKSGRFAPQGHFVPKKNS